MLRKLFFVPDDDGCAFWGDTADEIFDDLAMFCAVDSDVFTCGYLVDITTMTVKRAEFGFERKRVIDIQ